MPPEKSCPLWTVLLACCIVRYHCKPVSLLSTLQRHCTAHHTRATPARTTFPSGVYCCTVVPHCNHRATMSASCRQHYSPPHRNMTHQRNSNTRGCTDALLYCTVLSNQCPSCQQIIATPANTAHTRQERNSHMRYCCSGGQYCSDCNCVPFVQPLQIMYSTCLLSPLLITPLPQYTLQKTNTHQVVMLHCRAVLQPMHHRRAVPLSRNTTSETPKPALHCSAVLYCRTVLYPGITQKAQAPHHASGRCDQQCPRPCAWSLSSLFNREATRFRVSTLNPKATSLTRYTKFH